MRIPTTLFACSLLLVSATDMLRLRWNPFHALVESRLLDFVSELTSERTPERTPELTSQGRRRGPGEGT